MIRRPLGLDWDESLDWWVAHRTVPKGECLVVPRQGGKKIPFMKYGGLDRLLPRALLERKFGAGVGALARRGHSPPVPTRVDASTWPTWWRAPWATTCGTTTWPGPGFSEG